DTHAACLGHDAGICRVDAVDIGKNEALLGLQGGSHCYSRSVRAATAQRRDVPLVVDTLEAGNDHDAASVQVAADTGIVNGAYPRFGVGRVGAHGHLPARV